MCCCSEYEYVLGVSGPLLCILIAAMMKKYNGLIFLTIPNNNEINKFLIRLSFYIYTNDFEILNESMFYSNEIEKGMIVNIDT